jgi:hypothetical protein
MIVSSGLPGHLYRYCSDIDIPSHIMKPMSKALMCILHTSTGLTHLIKEKKRRKKKKKRFTMHHLLAWDIPLFLQLPLVP